MTNTIEQDVVDWLKKRAGEELERQGRERVADTLSNWLAFTARKKAMPDLDKRMEDFRKRIRVLAETVSLDIGPSGYVVKANGDAESTLQMLERGTDWFDPAANLTDMVVGAIFEQRS